LRAAASVSFIVLFAISVFRSGVSGRRLRAGGKVSWVIQFDFGGRTERLTLPGDLLAAKARAQALDIRAQATPRR
jgi:hypothetical protein